MHPTFTHVPPSVLSISTHTVESPSCAARIAPTYPPGPPPMMTTSTEIGELLFADSMSREKCPPLSPRRAVKSIDQHRRRIFHQLLHANEEEHGLLTIDDPVVVGEGHVHHRSNLDLAGHRHRSFLDLVQPEDADLREIDDRRRD